MLESAEVDCDKGKQMFKEDFLYVNNKRSGLGNNFK